MVEPLNINNIYMEMFRTLSIEDKLDLISQLIKSMKKKTVDKKETADVFACFSTDWGGSMTTEDYADMLRSENIVSSRDVESWCSSNCYSS